MLPTMARGRGEQVVVGGTQFQTALPRGDADPQSGIKVRSFMVLGPVSFRGYFEYGLEKVWHADLRRCVSRVGNRVTPGLNRPPSRIPSSWTVAMRRGFSSSRASSSAAPGIEALMCLKVGDGTYDYATGSNRESEVRVDGDSRLHSGQRCP